MAAREIRVLRRMTVKIVENEERSQLFRRLIDKKLGCKEEEEFVNMEIRILIF